MVAARSAHVGLRGQQDAAMPLFRINGKVIHFVHIPKTGGASIEAFCRSLGDAAMLAGGRGMLPCSPQHMHAQLHTPLGLDAIADWSFAIVRDPLARLLSEYRFRRRQAELLEAHPDYRLADVEPNDLPSGARATFDAWVAHVADRYRRDPFVLDNHLRPQAAFVSPAHRVFRFEDGLEAVTAAIAQACGVESPPPTPHENRTTATPITAKRATLRRMVALYEADFRRFGYAPPAEDALAPSHDAVIAGLMAEPEIPL